MTRKLTNLLAIMLMLIATACSQTQTEARIRAEVEKQNLQCPMDVGNGVTINSITYDDNVITYDSTIDLGFDVIALLKQNSQQIHQMIMDEMTRSLANSMNSEELELYRQAGTRLLMVFRSPASADTYEVSISPKDMTLQ